MTTRYSPGARQRDHYHKINEVYVTHYFDNSAMLYRKRFFFEPMLQSLNLNNKDVAEIAAGAGFNSAFVQKQFPKARLVGFDICPVACRSYSQNVNRPAYEVDLTIGTLPHQAFDIVFVIGGLHHCISGLDHAIEEVANTLRPGGVFIAIEPNRDCFLQFIRKIWYRFDKYFDFVTEQALSHDQLAEMSSRWFEIKDIRYLGGPGYFLILNSLILRVPRPIKYFITPLFIFLDTLYNLLPGRRPFPYFIARWVRKAV